MKFSHMHPVSLSALLLLTGTLLMGCGGGTAESQASARLASAKEYVGKKDYKAAVIELKAALQKNPNNREARLLLGSSLLTVGDGATAEIELKKALDLGASPNEVQPLLAKAVLAQNNPKQVVLQFVDVRLDRSDSMADLRTTVATAQASLGERDRALETTLAALVDSPQHVPALLLHARLKAAKNDVDGALALTDQVLSGSKYNLAALMLKGDLQRFGQRNVDAAMLTYSAAITGHPSAVVPHVAMMALQLEKGDIPGAKATYEKLKLAEPKNPETTYAEAQLAYIDRNFKRARELTGQLLQAYPNDMRVLQLAGINELMLNSLTQAEAHLGRVMKAHPDAPLPRQMLARIYTRTGQPAKALEVLRPLIEGPAADSNSLTLAGEALLQSGEPARAEAAFARASKGNPQATTARTALALGQLSKGNASAGFNELEAVAATDQGVRSNLALIAARMRSNDPAGALRAIADLEKKQPDGPLAHSLRGAVLVQKKDVAGARASFERALKLDPLFYAATAGLVGMDLAAGKPEQAQTHLDALLRLDPRNVRALLGLAELKARTGGSKDDISAAISAAVKADPGEPAAHLLLVRHLLGNQDNTAALTAAQNALAALPDNVEVMELLGAAQLLSGQHKQAVTTFTKLASLRPDRPEPHLRLADTFAASNDLPSAKASLNKALEIKPGFLPAQRGLAMVALRQENPQEALRIAQAMQKAQPQSAAGLLLEADIELGRKLPEAAIAPLRKALALGGGSEVATRLHSALVATNRSADAQRFADGWVKDKAQDAAFRFYLGDLALAAKDFAAAEARYRSVLEVQPDNALALNNVAWLMGQQKRPGALALAEKANLLLPNQPAVMDTLAYLLALENQSVRAVSVQKSAIAAAPENQGLRLTLAKIYLQTGDKARARTELESLAQLGEKFGAQAEVTKLMGSL